MAVWLREPVTRSSAAPSASRYTNGNATSPTSPVTTSWNERTGSVIIETNSAATRNAKAATAQLK